MKKNLLLSCTLFLLALNTRAQVAAGVADNLHVGMEAVNLHVSAFSLGDYMEATDSLDLNSDGHADMLFYIDAGQVPDYSGSLVSVQGMHMRLEMMVDSLNYVRALTEGDSINAQQQWNMVENFPFSSPLCAGFYGFTGQLQTYGNWVNHPEAYAGFRLIIAQPSDTLYGWMKIRSWAKASPPDALVQVNSGQWAIETAGASAVNTTANEALQLYPNPCSQYLILQTPEYHEVPVLRIFDGLGNLIHTRNIVDINTRIETGKWPAGTYFWEMPALHKSGRFLKN